MTWANIEQCLNQIEGMIIDDTDEIAENQKKWGRNTGQWANEKNREVTRSFVRYSDRLAIWMGC
jgi:hypothetical protein